MNSRIQTHRWGYSWLLPVPLRTRRREVIIGPSRHASTRGQRVLKLVPRPTSRYRPHQGARECARRAARGRK